MEIVDRARSKRSKLLTDTWTTKTPMALGLVQAVHAVQAFALARAREGARREYGQ
jgi:hypothetical protein